MEVAYRTETGYVRTRNEDALLARPERGLLVVADGLGGHPAGDVASMAAVRSLDAGDLSPKSSDDELFDALRAAHDAVLAAGAEDPARRGLGTTVVVGLVDEGSATIAHVGDSRAYLAHDGRLDQLTRDHSVQGFLTQALGLDRQVSPDIVRVDCPPGSRLLLCTDGLTNMLDPGEIADLLVGGDAQQACDALVERALDEGGVDNVTVVVVAF